jgi:hypothetical protein
MNGTNAALTYVSIWAAGAQIAASEQGLQQSATSRRWGFCCIAVVTVNGAQAIEGRWRASSGTSTMYNRTLMILKVA